MALTETNYLLNEVTLPVYCIQHWNNTVGARLGVGWVGYGAVWDYQ